MAVMNAIAAYKEAEEITLEELAKRLNLKSKGHASELVKGSAKPSVAVAKTLGELTGQPWHEIVDGAA